MDEPQFPIVITGRRKALLKKRFLRLRDAILIGIAIGVALNWAVSEALLNWILFFGLVPLILLVSAVFVQAQPRLRLEADALYVESDGGKIAHYWNDIGPVRLTATSDQHLIWWRSIGAENATAASGGDLTRFSVWAEHVVADVFFADPATEAAAFVATMNQCREAEAVQSSDALPHADNLHLVTP